MYIFFWWTIYLPQAFVALMGAEDAESALERILQLGLRGPVEREAVRVLIDCAAQEAVYNPFYGAVGTKLCNYHNRYGNLLY